MYNSIMPQRENKQLTGTSISKNLCNVFSKSLFKFIFMYYQYKWPYTGPSLMKLDPDCFNVSHLFLHNCLCKQMVDDDHFHTIKSITNSLAPLIFVKDVSI